MAELVCDVLNYSELPNGFANITLQNSGFVMLQPGHYITINQTTCYIMKASEQQIEIIVPLKSLTLPLSSSIITSSVQGSPFLSPIPHEFNLIICNNTTLPGCLFYFKKNQKKFKGLVLIQVEGALPFFPTPSRFMIPSLPAEMIACLPLLEDWGIANRLLSSTFIPGAFQGTLNDLIAHIQKCEPTLRFHRLDFLG